MPKREQAKQVLTDPSTWTGLVYLGTHMVIGIASLIILSVGVATAVTFTFAPVFASHIGPFGDEAVFNFNTAAREGAIFDFGSWGHIDTATEAWVLVPIGLGVAVLTAYVISGWATITAKWARVMLGSRARDIPAPPATIEDGPAAAAVTLDARIATLTSRERDVLLLMARGYSNAEIAEAFVVSEGTVKTHVKRILAKLDVRDRTQAAVFAFDSGFVTPALASEPEPR